MTPESLSDQIVAVASLILGAACLVMGWCALVVWRSWSKDRMEKRLAEMSEQFRAVTDRLQPAEAPIRKRRELPSA